VHSSQNNHNKVDAGSVATRTKRVLVLTYSQTGQLTRIIDSLLAPLRQEPSIQVHVEVLRPRVPYPFPWSIFSFFDAFPESAHLVGPALEPLTLSGDEDFDLVILPYQVWFLAPSLPVTAFLQHPVAQRLLHGKPVVTVIACRNMWMLAQEKTKQLLAACGARLIDNVVLTDPSATLVTLVTTPWWLLTGHKVFPGFPPAGIDDASIAQTARFGLALRDALHADAERGAAPLLQGLKACEANPGLFVSERAGTRSFYLWGKLLRAAGEPQALLRKPLLVLYIAFLILLIVSVVPVSLLLQALLRPLLKQRMQALKQRFEMPSGSGVERMGLYGHSVVSGLNDGQRLASQ
jgi:hypothetical protein